MIKHKPTLDQLSDQLRYQLEYQLWGQFKYQLSDQLRYQLGYQLGDQLGDQLGINLGFNLGINFGFNSKRSSKVGFMIKQESFDCQNFCPLLEILSHQADKQVTTQQMANHRFSEDFRYRLVEALCVGTIRPLMQQLEDGPYD